MRIGTVKEIRTHEYRVGLTPSCVRAYVARGHQVCVERGAGQAAGFTDDEYIDAGAQLVDSPQPVYEQVEMVVKVKEPQANEWPHLRPGQILYTYLHLAAAPELARALLERQVKAVAYETIETADGHLPCLKPMSEIAGRLAVQEGAKYLEKTFGGRGILLGGVPGVKRGRVVILGAGVAGTNACKIATGIGADVTVLDIDATRLAYLDDIFGSRITTLYSTDANILDAIRDADVVIGTVLVPGAKAPKLVRREHLARMKRGAVLVDVAIDQGGCFETSRPTTHDDPIFVVDGIVHYAVANMPGAVALSSTVALTSATLRYGLMIAEHGLEAACRRSPALAHGVNLFSGRCVHPNVAASLNLPYTPLDEALAADQS